MTGKCLRCDSPFELSADESARLRQFYRERAMEPPTEVFGICSQCWYGGPAEPIVPLPRVETQAPAAPVLSAKYQAGMNPQLRERLEIATAGKLDKAEAMQVIAAARRSVSTAHQAYLKELHAVLATGATTGSSVSAAEVLFFQDLHAVLVAEAAIGFVSYTLTTKSEPKAATNRQPTEIYGGVEIYSIVLGRKRPMAGQSNGLARFKCEVNATTVVSCTREGIRAMIDRAQVDHANSRPQPVR
jgi:hypothetical protein